MLTLALLAMLGCGDTTKEPGGAPGSDSAATATTVAAPADICDTDGLTRRPFLSDAVFGTARHAIAADFTVPTTTGDWTLSDAFTGCESYVFLSDGPVRSVLDDTVLVTDVDDLQYLLEHSPRNVHYFLATETPGRAEVEAFVEKAQKRVDKAIRRAEGGDHFADRMHIITKSIDKLDWLYTAYTEPLPGFAIDRFQRIRELGSWADVTLYDPALEAASGWPWADNLGYAAHEVQRFNYESDLDDRVRDPKWTTLYLLYDEPLWTSGNNTWDVELPDAETMAGFDTLLVDLQHRCDTALMEYGNCDAWDQIQDIWLCQPDDPTVCDIELARYITTYHREGRWLADASELLGYLSAGGTFRMQLRGARGGHFVSTRLLLGNEGKGGHPYRTEKLWTGGGFDENYDDNHPPLTIDVPADATKVHLTVIVTGHGFGNGPNCAEFCDHQHFFEVGGETFTAEHPTIDDQEGCLKQIPLGTVPNQYGTWWFNRSSWCPGMQVEPWVFDITKQVTPGKPATITYTTNYGAVVFGGSIDLSTYVTFWK